MSMLFKEFKSHVILFEMYEIKVCVNICLVYELIEL